MTDAERIDARRKNARRNGRQWGAIAVAVLVALTVADRDRAWPMSRIVARGVSIGLVFLVAYGLALLGERLTRRWGRERG